MSDVIATDGEVLSTPAPLADNGDRTILAALARAQAEFPEIPKDLENSHFKTKYSSLDAIVSTCRPVLAKHGLGFTHRCEHDGERTMCVCYLIDVKTGRMLAMDSEPLRGIMSNAQAAGSARTYARRYTLTATLGITSDEDDDGNGASLGQGNGSKANGKPPANRGAKGNGRPPANNGAQTNPPAQPPAEPTGDPLTRAKAKIDAVTSADDLYQFLKKACAAKVCTDDPKLTTAILRYAMDVSEVKRQNSAWEASGLDSVQAHIKQMVPGDSESQGQFTF